jgi:co-chaperonin GroES (HSP10)
METIEAPASTSVPAVPKTKKYRAIPINNWVLIIQHIAAEEKTEGGVVKPGQDFMGMPGAKGSRGEIFAAAEGVPLQKGDLVTFSQFAIPIVDPEELTGVKNLKLVRFEEVYCKYELED